ncbi:MAG: hypothetical protein Q9221_000128 [Calogaya cf. arnoldii]
MNWSHLLTLISYLLFISKPLLAAPFTDASSEVAAKTSSRLELRSPYSVPSHYFKSFSTTIVAGNLAYHLYFRGFTQALPIKAARLGLQAMYFDINFNLTPYGKWYNLPPQSRILLRAGEMYLQFVAADALSTVPWEIVKRWADVLERLTSLGGFVGLYSASFQRSVGGKTVVYWVSAGIGDPALLAAPAA